MQGLPRPGAGHCRAPDRCGAPRRRRPRPDEHGVASALTSLKAGSGSHSPSVAAVQRALPGLVKVYACFLSNPHATDAAMTRLRDIPPAPLERMLSHYGVVNVILQPGARVPLFPTSSAMISPAVMQRIFQQPPLEVGGDGDSWHGRFWFAPPIGRDSRGWRPRRALRYGDSQRMRV